MDRLKPADRKRDALIGVAFEFAESIPADQECIAFSVHQLIDNEAALFAVVHYYESVAVVSFRVSSLDFQNEVLGEC